MDKTTCLPDRLIENSGIVSKKFLELGIGNFIDACRYINELPYGYNSDRDDLMILFKENMGSCATKHAVAATLAGELDLPVAKNVGIYPMTEEIVTGTDAILEKYELPCVPMIHCFLAYENFRVDLTEGNHNGKNRPIDEFFLTEKVAPDISAKDEYILYRNALKDRIMNLSEWEGIEMKRILHAREEGIALLQKNLD